MKEKKIQILRNSDEEYNTEGEDTTLVAGKFDNYRLEKLWPKQVPDRLLAQHELWSMVEVLSCNTSMDVGLLCTKGVKKKLFVTQL